MNDLACKEQLDNIAAALDIIVVLNMCKNLPGNKMHDQNHFPQKFFDWSEIALDNYYVKTNLRSA